MSLTGFLVQQWAHTRIVHDCISDWYYSTLSVIIKQKPGIMLLIGLGGQESSSKDYGVTFLECLRNISVLPEDKVKAQLDEVLNTLQRKSDKSSESENLASRASTFLNISETLVSLLVKPTDTEELLNFTSNTTEVKVYTVGPNATLKNVLRLSNTAALMDIDIISIAKNNKGHASVAFMTYDNMSEILQPTFFPSKKGTVNTMMSTVVSASLPKTTNKTLINPVNFTLKHIREMDPTGTLYCVYWDKTEWSTNGCVRISEENSNDTICSCTHLSTFALLMQTEKLPEWSHRLELLSTIAVTVGLIFLSLAVLTFILFRKNSRVSSVLRLNLCICLLLSHLLFLLTQRFLAHSSYKVLCSAFAGILHFLFLSAFVWMFLEAVTLFISVKNLSKIKSRRREVLHWKYQLVIGYVVPTLVVGVSVAVQRDGYDSETCWIKLGTSFVWSFLGPVCFILAVNLILFIIIIITLQCTLMHLSGDVSQIKNSRTMVFKALAQFFILGCPWILGFSIKYGEGVEIIFLLLTSQQGTFIFLVHCVLSEEVRKQYKKLWYTLCPHHEISASVNEQMTEPSNGRYTLEDSGTGEFTVTISKLKKSDSGSYSCVINSTAYDKVDIIVVGDDESTTTVLKTTTQPTVTDHTDWYYSTLSVIIMQKPGIMPLIGLGGQVQINMNWFLSNSSRQQC
ncbi:adhesion G protein-coupled receptor E3-like [Chanos chanos]|uniref:Adhesion G protein-coupled receptor E3-like n=1 Tax=Chanos chanos TaxID=29144 RepID=A0A6J2VU34_CHACN|nr:adhesion G protein-coupled receptor E3-like [Chanos chanos]